MLRFQTVPLQLFYSSYRNDHLTVASKAGIEFATLRGYQLVNATLGYVYTQPKSSAAPSGSLESSQQRLAYSIELLASAFQ